MTDYNTATGHVRVEERAKGRRVWVAEYQVGDGARTRKTLGSAWVRPSGRTTARGAVLWRAGHGSKPDDTYLTPAEAEAKLGELLDAERRRPSVARAARGKTFGDAIERWLDWVEHEAGVDPGTLRGYRVISGKLKQKFPADMPLRQFTKQSIEDYQSALLRTPVVRGKKTKQPPRPLARTTVRKRMLVLTAILERARALGWLAVNPAQEVTIVADPGADPDFNVLAPKQVEDVAAAMAEIPDDELPLMRNGEVDTCALAKMRECRTLWAEAVRLAAYTGLRFGELRDLRWRDIDWEGRVLHVRRNTPTSAPASVKSKRPKGKRARSLPLIDQAVEVLRRIQAIYPSASNDLVLPNRANGMLGAGRVRDAFYRGLVGAGMGYLREKDNPMTFHDLRHTFGTLAARKLPLNEVQAYLGHADIATTMRYVHHIPRSDAARQLSEAFAA
jgi:integrase